MKNIIYFVLSAVLAASIVFISCSIETSNPVISEGAATGVLLKSGGNGPSVNGQATIMYEGSGLKRIITFHAAENKDGVVEGGGTLVKNSPDEGLIQKIKFDVDCLSVNENVAILGGIITWGSDSVYGPEYWTGRRFQFKVTDNGEGKNAVPDEITHMINGTAEDDPFGGFPYPCTVDTGWDLMPIVRGNIQVRL
ncbi:MAG: hypothetical protein JW995_13690 [Melioribacteraceae bacterium]|nr:hypothetical protein [Melioribacteraceae bacterium]